MKIKIDPSIPPDEIHLRNADGKTIGKIINLGEPLMNPTLKAAHDLFCQEPDPNRPRKGESFWEWAERRRWELFVEGERLKGPAEDYEYMSKHTGELGNDCPGYPEAGRRRVNVVMNPLQKGCTGCNAIISGLNLTSLCLPCSVRLEERERIAAWFDEKESILAFDAMVEFRGDEMDGFATMQNIAAAIRSGKI